MKNTLQSIFRDYPHLYDEAILSNLLNKVDNESLQDIKNLEDLSLFLFELNKHIEKNDLLSILFKLQANITIIDYALKDYDNDLASCLRTLNLQNIQFTNEVISMLDFIELK